MDKFKENDLLRPRRVVFFLPGLLCSYTTGKASPSTSPAASCVGKGKVRLTSNVHESPQKK
jgi:hypothetical protein